MEDTDSDTGRRYAQPTDSSHGNAPRLWRTRLLWLVGLWSAGVLSTALVVEIVRLAMEAAGLKTH